MNAHELPPPARVRWLVQLVIERLAQSDKDTARKALLVAVATLDEITHPADYLESFVLTHYAEQAYLRAGG